MFRSFSFSCRCLLLAGFGAASMARAGGPDFGAQFRDPPANATRPGVALALASLASSEEAARRQLASLRACGVGSVLVRTEKGDSEAWLRLGWVTRACRELGLELGLGDFLLPGEEVKPKLRRLIWTASGPGDAQGGGVQGCAVCQPADGYREIARLAVPTGGVVLAHQVEELAAGAASSAGTRLFCFGCVDVAPPRVDCFDGKGVFAHVNRILVESQNRLASAYGTTFQWYQWEGPGQRDLFWFSDFSDAFLKSSGLGLVRHLPVLAGVEIGGEKNAAYVRQHVAQTIREAWRQRCARQVDDLVHEAGLEAGVAVDDVPLEPEEAALYFHRVTLSPEDTPSQSLRNERAAGASRALGREFVVGHVRWSGVSTTLAQALLPFRCKHELDRLYCDGANRILVEWPGDVPVDGERFAQLQVVCRYAHRCQAALQRGDAVCDFLVWSPVRPKLLSGYACDWTDRTVLDSASVKRGAVQFESERRYRDVAVTADTLRASADANRLRQLAEAGVTVWLAADGQGGEDELFGRFEGTAGFRRLGGAGAGTPAPDLLWTADEEGVNVRFVHRRTPAEEIYYVANVGSAAGTATCSFRDAGRGVLSRWDPVGGEEVEGGSVSRSADGRATVPIFLGPHESVFVVFAR